MRKIIYILFILLVMLCGCDEKNDEKTISVAVTGSPSAYSRYFEQGIKEAYEVLCKEYPDYNILCEFYDDRDDYVTAEKITSRLVDDDRVTAIIASSSPDIFENQVYQADLQNKLIVCPHCVYDETLKGKGYKNVFSLNHSGEQIGWAMGYVTKKLGKEKWALCYSSDSISKSKIRGFGKDNDVVDSVKINELEADFNKTVQRWKTLGVEGIVFIPDDNDKFDLLYRLKDEMPWLYVIGDSDIDDMQELDENRAYFNNVCIVDSFYVSDDDEEIFSDDSDTWEVHGYNTMRMIVDTAVKNNTNDPLRIAEILHNDGYEGVCESYNFDAEGILINDVFSYVKIDDEDESIHKFTSDEGGK